MSGRAKSTLPLTLLLIILVTATIKSAVAVTWADNMTRMTTELIFEGLPSITQINDGRIWIVWVKAILGDNTLFYKTSSNLGTTWTDENNLTYIPEDMIGRHDSRPSIIQATNGTIWLVWASNKPPLPTEPDFSIDALPQDLTIPQGGSDNSTIIIASLRNFNEPVSLSARNPIIDVNTTLAPGQVTPPPNGTANSTLTVSVEPTAIPGNYTLTVLGRSGELEHRVEIALEVTASGMATLSDASSSSNSTPSSEYEMDYEIFCKTSNDNGATWSNRFQLTNNNFDDLNPSIIQLKNGTIMIVQQSGEDPGNPNIFYNATSDGTSWTYGNITDDLGLDKGPCLMQAKDEKIWVVWASNRTGDFEIFSKTHDGMSWSSAINLTNNVNDDTNPSILQTVDGTIWLFWTSRETSTATGDIYYKYSTDNGATWSDRTQFTTDPYEDLWPSLAQTSDARIWVVWTSDRANQPDGNWDIYYKRSLAGDVNGDGEVDILDLAIVGNACGTVEGQPGYNPVADINKDGRVDIRDLAVVGRNYGAT